MACADEPAPPAPGYTLDDVAIYILDLAAAGDDCRAKLGRVREFVEGVR